MEVQELLDGIWDELILADELIDRWEEDGRPPPSPYLKKLSFGMEVSKRPITTTGAEYIFKCSEILLERLDLQARVTLNSAKNCLISAISDALVQSRDEKFENEFVIEKANSKISAVEMFSGRCFFPANLSVSGDSVDTRIGCVRIVATDLFVSNEVKSIRDHYSQQSNDNNFARLSHTFNQWIDEIEKSSHIFVVDVQDIELELAKIAANRAAEFVLNLIRVMTSKQNAERMRISSELGFVNKRTSMAVTYEGILLPTVHLGGSGSFLPDDWSSILMSNIKPVESLIVTLVNSFVKGFYARGPIPQKFYYANDLLTEALIDPVPRTSIIKLVSVLETLTSLPRLKKSKRLTCYCVLACNYSNAEDLSSVKHAIHDAYQMRNKVVHGDAPFEADVRIVIDNLFNHYSNVLIGLWIFCVDVQRACNPKDSKMLLEKYTEALRGEYDRQVSVWPEDLESELFEKIDDLWS